MSYDKIWLSGNLKQMEIVFYDFVENEPYAGYDFFSLVDVFMQTSAIRQKMDEGSWSAMNKGDKQILADIDLSLVKEASGDKVYSSVARWMGQMYSYYQWMYGISSRELNKMISARELYKCWSMLKELSYEGACKRLHDLYFCG